MEAKLKTNKENKPTIQLPFEGAFIIYSSFFINANRKKVITF